MKKKISIGIIGLGTVGQGVVEIFCRRRKSIFERAGAVVEIAAVCDTDAKKIPRFLEGVYTKNWADVVNNPHIDLVVELVGGYEPARTIILESLKAGKDVVTANKSVLAGYWGEIFTAVKKYKKLIYFEAAVGGGIPVVQSLNEGLAANAITKISGILNGTTNFILTKMHKDNLSFESSLKAARRAGFAESNPSYDLKGLDTANKLAILASIASGSWVRVGDITIEGIDRIFPTDIQYLKNEFDYTVKLIGKAIFNGNKMDISVRPTLISGSHPFRNVDGEYNAVMMHGDAAGDLMFYGKGAGAGPAASAVMSDVIFLSRQIVSNTNRLLPYIHYNPDKEMKVLDSGEREGFYYLRFSVEDRPGVLAAIAGVLARNNVSIAAVYQNVPQEQSRKGASIIIMTHKTNEGKLLKSLNVIDGLKSVRGKSVVYPIER